MPMPEICVFPVALSGWSRGNFAPFCLLKTSGFFARTGNDRQRFLLIFAPVGRAGKQALNRSPDHQTHQHDGRDPQQRAAPNRFPLSRGATSGNPLDGRLLGRLYRCPKLSE
jgi:hypothetical protein